MENGKCNLSLGTSGTIFIASTKFFVDPKMRFTVLLMLMVVIIRWGASCQLQPVISGGWIY